MQTHRAIPRPQKAGVFLFGSSIDGTVDHGRLEPWSTNCGSSGLEQVQPDAAQHDAIGPGAEDSGRIEVDSQAEKYAADARVDLAAHELRAVHAYGPGVDQVRAVVEMDERDRRRVLDLREADLADEAARIRQLVADPYSPEQPAGRHL